MLVKYAKLQAKIRMLVIQDEIENLQKWEELKLRNYESLVDVKRDMDKFRKIQDGQVPQNLQNGAPSSSSAHTRTNTNTSTSAHRNTNTYNIAATNNKHDSSHS